MFWLAGLLGLMAVGGVVFLDAAEDAGAVGEDATDPDLTSAPPEAAPDVPDLVTGEPASPTGNLILSGDASDDILSGGEGDDQIGGYEGADVIFGNAGDDGLYGADGDDMLSGGDGDDTLHGEYGDDDLDGGDGGDLLFGHYGDDTLQGGGGDDEMHGGQDDDMLDGGDGDDALHGSDGNDILAGGEGHDTLFGGWGDDMLTGADDDGSDFLNGGGGDDTILAGASDVVTAGDGADSIVLDGRTAGIGAADLMDFNPAEDRLLMVWDMKQHPDPDIEVMNDPDDPGVSHIVVDGVDIALVRGDSVLSVQDILLVDIADAPVIGMRPL